ncbi:MAG: copper resistance protein CopC [Hyphomonadaceae bacterium]
MRNLTIAVALALAPSVAVADHNHGGHGRSDHAAQEAAPTMLSASTPSDGAVLAEAPRAVALMFAHPVALQNVTVAGPSGPVNTAFRPAGAASARYTIALPTGLAPGAYEARWTASGDGHQMNGIIRFTVQ